MWFMRCSIDVLFFQVIQRDSVSKAVLGKVTSVYSRVLPWKPLPLIDASASDVLELAPGTLEAAGVVVGDQICIELLS
jgi:uncharacterized membrane protein (UPF0127 family)